MEAVYGSITIITLILLSVLWIYGLLIISDSRKKIETRMIGGMEQKIELGEVPREKKRKWFMYTFILNFFVWGYIIFVLTICIPDSQRRFGLISFWEKAITWYGVVLIIIMGYLSIQGIEHLRNKGIWFKIGKKDESLI